MSPQRLRFWLAALLCVASLSGSAFAAPPTLEALFENPVFSAPRLSPDGRAVAMLVGAKGKRTLLAVLDLQTLQPTVVAAYDERDVRSVHWINDQRLVYDLAVEQIDFKRIAAGPGLFAVNADGSGSRTLIATLRAFVKAPEMGVPPLEGRHFPVNTSAHENSNDIYLAEVGEVSREKTDYFSLLRQNTVSGRTTPVDAPLHAVEWVFDRQGTLQAVVTQQANIDGVHLRQADGSWKQIAEYDGLVEGGIVPRWIGPDGTLYVTAGQGGKGAVFTLDAATSKPRGAALAASKDFDLHPTFIANQRQLLGLRYEIDAEVTQWLTPEMTALQAAIDKLLPATSNRLSMPQHGDSPWVLVESFADVQPTLSHIFNRQTGKLARVGAARPSIKPAQLGQTDFFRVPARDGLPLPVYLTLPPGATGNSAKKLPMVVLVHGGPWVRGGHWRFDAEVQLLATRGYAVLQPEFRGSTGFGRAHFDAGFKQWGRAMQDDVADATRWAIAQGHADPSRICIAGASYGGYATLMGLARNPELFKCGINWVGVTDLELMYSNAWSDFNEESKRYGWARLVGDPVADAEALKSASPLHNAALIKQPLLMAYGAWDTRVPLVHGERFRDAVKPHNDQVEWVVYAKEGHGWARPETRIDFWGRVERFLARHIGDVKPESANR